LNNRPGAYVIEAYASRIAAFRRAMENARAMVHVLDTEKKATRQNKKPSKSSELTLIAVAPTKYLEESMQ